MREKSTRRLSSAIRARKGCSAKFVTREAQNRILETTHIRITQNNPISILDIPLNIKFVPGYNNILYVERISK